MEQKDAVPLPNGEVRAQGDTQFQHTMLRTEPKESGPGGQSQATLDPQIYVRGSH